MAQQFKGQGKAPISAESHNTLVTYINALVDQFPRDQMSTRFEVVDHAYYRTKNTATQSKLDSKALGEFSALEFPLIQPHIDSLHAELCSIFLQGTPVFKLVGGVENIDAADTANALMAQHQQRGGWIRELTIFLLDGLKYNLHAVSGEWVKKTNGTMKILSKLDGKAETSEEVWMGNSIKRISPYNLYFDVMCEPCKVHEEGLFAGYNELVGLAGLRKLMDDLRGEHSLNYEKALRSSNSHNRYFQPSILPDFSSPEKKGGFSQLLGVDGAKSQGAKIKNYQQSYEVQRFFLRIVPSDFGITSTSKAQQVYKVVMVNWQHIIYVEPVVSSFGMFPIFIGQPLEGGLDVQASSSAEAIKDMQNYATTLLTSHLALLTRKVSDRMIYDQGVINKKDIENPNPSAKIPMRSPAYGKVNLANAVYQIPFNDTESGTLNGAMAFAKQMADDITGANPAQRGNFVKGNKTVYEFQETMGNAKARAYIMALFTEAQVFEPLKLTLKTNILLNQQVGKIYSATTQKEYDVDPSAMRQASLEFEVADGLNPVMRIMNADSLKAAMEFVIQVPSLQQQYDIGDLFAFFMHCMGMPNLRQFKLTDKDIEAQFTQQMKFQVIGQQVMQMMQQQQQAQGTPQAPAAQPQ